MESGARTGGTGRRTGGTGGPNGGYAPTVAGEAGCRAVPPATRHPGHARIRDRPVTFRTWHVHPMGRGHELRHSYVAGILLPEPARR